MPARYWLTAAIVGFGGAFAIGALFNVVIADVHVRFWVGVVAGFAWMQACIAIALSRWSGVQ